MRPLPPARAILHSLTLILGLSLVSVPNPASAQVYAQSAVVPVCSTAENLVRRGLPVHALALIIEAAEASAANTPRPCADETRLATQRIDESATKTREAQELLKDHKWADAQAAADAAQVANRDNEAARTAGQAAKDGAKQAEKSAFQELQESWKDFIDDELTPLAALLAPFLATLLVLLLAARLLVLLIVKWPALEGTPTGTRRRMVLIVGLLQLVSSSAMLTFGLAGLFKQGIWVLGLIALVTTASAAFALRADDDAHFPLRRRKPPESLRAGLLLAALIPTGLATVLYLQGSSATRSTAFILAVVSGLLGLFLTAWWLATRLRLEVKVTHEDDQDKRAEAALVTALLYELGTKKPEGLEVPRGADVTALTDALAALPESTLGKSIRSFLTALAGTTPWVAAIEGEQNGRTVSISRNGRAVGSAVIDSHSFACIAANADTKDSADDRLRDAPLHLASAFILMTLAKAHPSITNGLAGATNWQSLGLQFIAGTRLQEDSHKEQRRQVLGQALDLDLNNVAAQLAFRHAMDRDSTDPRVLIEYREWLKGREDELTNIGLSNTAIQLRTCYTRTVIATNAVFAEEPPDPEKTSVRVAKARTALADLDALVARTGHIDELQPIVASIKESSGGLRRLFAHLETMSGTEKPEEKPAESPTGAYNDACYFASKHSWKLLDSDIIPGPKPIETTNDDKAAVTLLQRAAVDPRLANWMLTDPQLREFRQRHAYRESFLQDPAADLFSCGPVKPHTDRLRCAGYGNASILAKLHSNPDPLADVIPADAMIRRAIIDIACLQTSFTADLKRRKWASQTLDELASLGLASFAALRALNDIERDRVAKTVAENIVKRYKTGEDLAHLSYKSVIEVLKVSILEWLKSLTKGRRTSQPASED